MGESAAPSWVEMNATASLLIQAYLAIDPIANTALSVVFICLYIILNINRLQVLAL